MFFKGFVSKVQSLRQQYQVWSWLLALVLIASHLHLNAASIQVLDNGGVTAQIQCDDCAQAGGGRGLQVLTISKENTYEDRAEEKLPSDRCPDGCCGTACSGCPNCASAVLFQETTTRNPILDRGSKHLDNKAVLPVRPSDIFIPPKI